MPGRSNIPMLLAFLAGRGNLHCLRIDRQSPSAGPGQLEAMMTGCRHGLITLAANEPETVQLGAICGQLTAPARGFAKIPLNAGSAHDPGDALVERQLPRHRAEPQPAVMAWRPLARLAEPTSVPLIWSPGLAGWKVRPRAYVVSCPARSTSWRSSVATRFRGR